jgi:hypothetical protein
MNVVRSEERRVENNEGRTENGERRADTNESGDASCWKGTNSRTTEMRCAMEAVDGR